MNRYPEEQSNIDWKTFPFTKFKIIVPTHEDKNELLQATKHLHDCDVDTGFVAVNQIVHLYEDSRNPDPQIIVDSQLYDQLSLRPTDSFA